MGSTISSAYRVVGVPPPPPPAESQLWAAIETLVAGSGPSSYTIFNADWSPWFGQSDPWAWNARMHWHDGPAPGQGKLLAMSKTAGSTGVPYRVHVYDEAANIATTPFNAVWSGQGGGSESGHHYDGSCVDQNGTLYFQHHYAERPLRFNGFGWDDIYPNFQANVTASNGVMEFHPNLFGAGDGGLVIPQNDNASQPSYIHCLRLASGAYDPARSATRATGVPGSVGNAQAIYVPALDAVVLSTNTDQRAFLIKREGGVITVTEMPNPLPVFCTANESSSSNTRMSRMFVTPFGTLAVFEAIWGSARVWRLNPTTLAWELQAFTHPFMYSSSLKSRFPGVLLKRYGVYMVLRPTGGTGYTISMMLWKPPAGF